MDNEEIAGYLIRRELESGEDQFWNLTENWVDDPGDAELYEREEEAEDTAQKLRVSDKLFITVEEVIYDDGEDGEFDDEDDED